MINKMREDMKRHTPKTGFNVVAVDDFEPAGEQIYLVAHRDTREEAEQALKDFQAKNKTDKAYIYGPQGS